MTTETKAWQVAFAMSHKPDETPTAAQNEQVRMTHASLEGKLADGEITAFAKTITYTKTAIKTVFSAL